MAQLKILIACIPTPDNRYLIDLKEGLETYAEVIWDYQAFWKCQDRFDVVHIHWPEYLSYDIEAYLYNQQRVSESLWESLKHCLGHWSQQSKIIYTRHNALPHARQDADFKALYQLVSSYAHTVVHFAHYSVQQFKEWYPELPHIKHVVIPHHNYASLANDSNREAARDKLGIHTNARVMLVFGSIKENEKPLIKTAFNAIPAHNKVLLAPGWKINRRQISYIRLRDWIWNLEKWWASKNKSFRINLGFIEEKDAHYYLNAADFLLIPRTNELNSGNITLGCTFGLVVVGKDTADIGELLKETGNPTFEVGNDVSLEKAVKQALDLSIKGHGKNNQKLAEQTWNIETIAKAYFDEMVNLV